MAPKLAYSTVQYRRGGREGEEDPVSKHQIRSGNGGWARRRGVGRLNPRRETKIQGKNEDREWDMKQKVANRRTLLARKRRWRGRAERRLLRQSEIRNQACARRREITVATHNVRSMTVDGTHGVGRALDAFECVRSTGVRRNRSAGDPPQWTLSFHPGWLRGVLYCTAAVSAVARMVGRKGKVE